MKQTRSIFLHLVIAVLALFSFQALAQAPNARAMKISSGEAKLTYSGLTDNIVTVCGDKIPLINLASKGSVENLDRLRNNQAQMAVVQTDALFFDSLTRDMSRIRTLVVLHPEEVHIVAPVVSKVKVGGVAGIGAKPKLFSTISDLVGYRIGVSGGSAKTASLIKTNASLGFETVEYDTNDAAKTALDSGDIQAWIVVAGQPAGGIQKLGKGYKLLSVPKNVQELLVSKFPPAVLDYEKELGAGGRGVATVSVPAVLATRVYEKPEVLQQLADLRQCIYDRLPDLKDDDGYHAKWQQVVHKLEDGSVNTGKWPYYDLSAYSRKQAAAQVVKSKK